jgi:hypothetical protein
MADQIPFDPRAMTAETAERLQATHHRITEAGAAFIALLRAECAPSRGVDIAVEHVQTAGLWAMSVRPAWALPFDPTTPPPGATLEIVP